MFCPRTKQKMSASVHSDPRKKPFFYLGKEYRSMGEVSTRMDDMDGMPGDCAINFGHIQTGSKKKIGFLIATLSSAKIKEVCAVVLFSIDL